jgi:histidinol-phosphate/aromatic aminotransferase/cobyric acid decarboxylase-like protein
VRWFGNSAFRDRLRITIGSKEEMEQCMHVIRTLAAKGAGA